MKFSYTLVLALQSFTLALPQGNKAGAATGVTKGNATKAEEGEGGNEIEQQAQFGVPVNLNNSNIKTDTLFPPGQNGVFEIETQNKDARILTVTENKTPAAPPAGFTALEPVSYIVKLEGGADGLTLQKIDYIKNADSTIDNTLFSTGKLGKLCTETNSFIIDGGVVETEFEAEENELATKVTSLIGEWALFVPTAAAATPATPAAGTGAGEGAGAGADTGATTGGAADSFTTLLGTLLSLLGGGAGAKTEK